MEVWVERWRPLGGSLGNEVTPSAENCCLFTLAWERGREGGREGDIVCEYSEYSNTY